jgi:hypothetical protein
MIRAVIRTYGEPCRDLMLYTQYVVLDDIFTLLCHGWVEVVGDGGFRSSK